LTRINNCPLDRTLNRRVLGRGSSSESGFRVDGTACEQASTARTPADATTTGGVVFTAATGLDANAIAPVQAQVRRRLLRGFARCGLLARDDARAMGQ
jgi:hypothetical protein